MSAPWSKSSRLARVAPLVDQLIQTVEGRQLSRLQATAAAATIADLITVLAARKDPDSRALSRALHQLAEALARAQTPAAAVLAPEEVAALAPEAAALADRRFSRILKRLVMIVGAGAIVSAPMAAAARDAGLRGSLLGSSAVSAMIAQGLVSATVGGTVINPNTGAAETVVEVLSNGAAARTSAGNIIMLTQTVGDTFVNSVDGKTYKVTAVTLNADNRVTQLTVQENIASPPPAFTVAVLTDKATDINNAGQPDPLGPGGAGGNFTFPTASGDINNVADARKGGDGAKGSDGGGVSICLPFVGCFTIGKDASNGGDGSAGPSFTRTITGPNIETQSNNLPGVVVSSVGGNGGKGGNAYIAVDGADGGKGGDGGDVTVVTSVQITTDGDKSHGVLVQSRAGKGGDGGDAYGVVSGGDGGAPGKGGTVDVTNNGQITTNGAAAHGILAQSLGGGAGGGGDAYGIVTESGTGGTGADGGLVKVANNGKITTTGVDSNAILAQSIGGSGGAGGSSGSLVAFGSSGGMGGDGGEVQVTNSGVITTLELGGRGVVAQSIGGGGGSASNAGGLVALGGDGAGGGSGGKVTVTNTATGSITTAKTGGDGILAQSIGGGGGAGSGAGGLAALGGKGSGGGNGGEVLVSNAGKIDTTGAFSRGIFAQSLGGGGGAGGSGGGLVSIGGSGGTASTGGVVTVENSGEIWTRGAMSSGVQAQSIGGGGGDGGASGGAFLSIGGQGGKGGKSDLVTVTHSGEIHTSGADSHGIFAQSVGGGGGNGGSAISLSVFAGAAVGGKAGDGGEGGAVKVNLNPTTTVVGGVSQTINPLIVTTGDRSRGVFAQSVGGGGGNGGFAAQVSAGYGVAAGVSVGGKGGKGGKGGQVQLDGDVTVFTSGESSQGLFAQSVGGGGGAGGFATTFTFAAGDVAAGAFAVGLGGAGGDGGMGDRVDVTSGGQITTTGRFSTGMVAQSVGGGGGSGGFAITFAGAGSLGPSVSASVGLGGSGGKGGKGGIVDAAFDGDIATGGLLGAGTDSVGALIQSVGGGGGSGGYAVAGAISVAGSVGGGAAVGVGGQGGDGGIGDAVTGRVGGKITTTADRSTGAIIQSVGGGGGSGGFAVAGSIGAGVSNGGAISVGVGGAGGKGGTGGDVKGSVGGDITTYGDQSGGLLVQSVGGGGGSGGFSVAGGVGVGSNPSGAISVGVGGAGGDGGAAGLVRGEAEGTVTTHGDQSAGVIVQSVGGGGGAGGFAVGGSIGASGATGLGFAVGVGGAGGKGGDGNEVDAFAKSITTEGDGSGGFLAQSVGGGGGSGGFSVAGAISGGSSGGLSASVGVGGSGGDGGAGKRVGATVTGDVGTKGADSDAIVAQSLGGGGGGGGFSVGAGMTLGGSASGTVAVGVGGAGGDGGKAGDVNLKVTGMAQTEGKSSDAILAQSVGGGGGSGGFAVAGALTLSGGAAGSVGVSVGGMGGGGGQAGEVELKVNDGVADPLGQLIAAVTTKDDSRAIVAQSIGGGGGAGGFSVTGLISAAKDGAGNVGVGVGGGGGDGGDGLAAHGEIKGAVSTKGKDASGVLVQSVGGGGGAGGFNVTGGVSASKSVSGNILVGVGGFGGKGGAAGEVTGGVTGDIYTEGDGAFGVSYQSIGGGGGSGGFNITGGVSLAVASGGGTGTVGVGVGGFGGDGGFAQKVDATLVGDITTKGDKAHAALLQSVGGGGGSGGFNITGLVSASSGVNGSLGFGLGGFGGGGGDAGLVKGVLTGDVWTEGDDAFGALLQSVGGGGGQGGFNVTDAISLSVGNNAAVAVGLGVGGFGGDGGKAESVTGVVTGRYVTSGANADAVTAQSIGGGGGAGGFNVSGNVAISGGTAGTGSVGVGGFGGGGGDSGVVTLTRVGDTYTDGANSDGVVAQSLAGGGGSGGVNVSGGLAISAKGSAGGIGVGVGGFGGDGGAAGDVTAHVTGNVIAKGVGSDVSTPEFTVTIPIFDIPVTFAATRTRLDGSNGVMAQSVGGGGGSGGVNVTGQLTLSAPGGGGSSRTAAIGIGGFGGAGGDAGVVDLTIDGPTADKVQIVGAGDDRYAAAAQSIGGGGGAGGLNVSGGVAMDGTLVVGVGGFGGDGGLGKKVTADIDANLFASGNRSRGLLAQSIGGGGGAGGINVSGAITPDLNTEEPSIAFGLGGYGGAGNASGDVKVRQDGQVWVDGQEAIGVLVQSVAGGGGSGGLNVAADITAGGSTSRAKGYGLAVGIGGTAGDGADAGDVELTSLGNVIVNGQLKATPPAAGGDPLEAVLIKGGATGVLVQSVGGGGGVGGVNATAAVAPFGNPIAVGVGGSGGSGGNAGQVHVVRGYDDVGGVETAKLALIRTFGDKSDGLVAQSIGGGGGKAGMNFTIAATVSAQNDNPIAALITIGGGGAGAGSGDLVDVRHAGDIVTDGVRSRGLLAQSVGGGGGDAALNIGAGVLKDANALKLAVGGAVGAGGSGGAVTVEHDGTIVTRGAQSVGIQAQSIGGGGGDTGLDFILAPLNRNEVSISVGRQGGTGGAAGKVTVDADGTIDTTGDESSAIFAQSIGGGGGNSSATTVGATGTRGTGSEAESYAASVSIGIDGGVGATGGDVDVDAAGTITTRGASSRGIWAQSIGGGGGAGGVAGATVVRAAGAATLAVGGGGGTGATSGKVEVDSSAVIVTTGEQADGVLAQSIGGGGGLGGMARTVAFQVGGPPPTTTQRTASVSVGGTGGTGAVGGEVWAKNTGAIVTSGEKAAGVRAQSIGGGGGIGGAVLDVRLQGKNASDSMNLNIGGDGGTGGAGGKVEVVNEGLIWTKGQGAAGVSANSIGGGGGDGGLVLNVVAGYNGADAQSHTFFANFGGAGGVGGLGGQVDVTNRQGTGADSGKIITEGKDAYGVFAQSLGGGGGNGSTVVSITGLKSAENSVSAGLTVGGKGGSGNNGGLVHVVNDGLIDTAGEGAHGVLAQSIGGGGGNGGMAIAANMVIGSTSSTPLVTLGGFGGGGGDGAKVTVDNTGDIVTRGDRANGIVAQSIGGGGGNAQMGFSLTGEAKSLILSNQLSLLAGVLGGGAGGLGGDVEVNHSGDITVLGKGSKAIKAESVNGGGGSLTFDVKGLIGLPGQPYVDPLGQPARADPMIVGKAGAEGVSNAGAGKVVVNTTGTYQAAGDDGAASFDQSVGGGGGTVDITALLAGQLDEPNLDAPVPVRVKLALGGANGRNNTGGDIEGAHAGDILTTGRNAAGVFSQSVGGGGGQGTINVTTPQGAMLGPVMVSLGAENGADETGGVIERQQDGEIVTAGDYATGAMLQSVGGGGGSTSVRLDGAGSSAATVVASLGASGGSGLAGGAIDSTFGGGISTLGDHAVGLIAQSIGAGGGEAHVSGGGSLQAALGGTNGAAGDGGAIRLANTGDIVTSGEGSHGVFLQSIGGGGGAVFGGTGIPSVSLSAANAGDGGAITFTQTGGLYALGDGAFGLVAQSLGGGGGWVDGAFAGSAGGAGHGGTINLTMDGTVLASGAGSTAILAQSLGADGAGDIALGLTGFVRGGGGAGSGVKIDGGAANLVDNTGVISAVSGLAIASTGGDETVANRGAVIGNIDLGSGDNRFDNQDGALFVAFNTIDLRDPIASHGLQAMALAPSAGPSATFTNGGEFQMGLSAPRVPIDLANGAVFANLDAEGPPAVNPYYGARVINTVALDGHFVQTPTGHLTFDVAFGPYASDVVNATGNVTVAGTGDVTLTWLQDAKEVKMFTAGGAAVDNGLAIRDTLAMDYKVRAADGAILLGYTPHFDQGFLNGNGQSLGRHMNSLLTVGGSGGVGRLMALLGNMDAGDKAEYGAVFKELNPEPYLAPLRSQLISANGFSDQLFSCSAPTSRTNQQCVWVVAERATAKGDADAETLSVRAEGERFRAGFERPMANDWSLAAAVGFETLDRVLVDGVRARSDGQNLSLGLGLKHGQGVGAQFAGSLSGGWQWMNTERMVEVFQIGRGQAKPESGYLQARARFSYVARKDRLFAEPALNAWATALHQKAFQEKGLDGLGVAGVKDTQVIGTINPELKLGFVFKETASSQAAVSFTVGGVFNSKDRLEAPYRLIGANPASDPAVIGTSLDKSALKLGADVHVIGDDRVSVRFNYTAEIGDKTENRSAGLNVKVRF
ncbi:MAG: autotransporter outer membrane beta-barrel domain-containing protein [Caulobacter sp.]|nr:autotransporter outer membrane beta-barrel domain-containing protein [Caulobacter sp.]